MNLLTIAQESKTVLSLFIGANLLIGFSLLVRNPRARSWLLTAGLTAAGFMLLFGASMGWKIYQERNNVEAIIVEEKVDVRSGPGVDNITVVTVHEGAKVRVRGEISGWYQISLPNGWNGWLPASSIRIL